MPLSPCPTSHPSCSAPAASEQRGRVPVGRKGRRGRRARATMRGLPARRPPSGRRRKVPCRPSPRPGRQGPCRTGNAGDQGRQSGGRAERELPPGGPAPHVPGSAEGPRDLRPDGVSVLTLGWSPECTRFSALIASGHICASDLSELHPDNQDRQHTPPMRKPRHAEALAVNTLRESMEGTSSGTPVRGRPGCGHLPSSVTSQGPNV